MSNFSSSSTRTPGLVLGGVVTLVVAAVFSLPFPLLGGLLIAPALLVAAVLGYLDRPSSRIVAISASAAALLIDLLSIVLVFTQPSRDLAFLSALHTIYGFFCFLCALAGTTMLWLGSRTERPMPCDAHRMGTSPVPIGDRALTIREDLVRVGAATALGARRAVAAWETYQRLSEPRRQRAAARAERRERQQAKEREMRIRYQAAELSSQDKEIRKAQLRQAREYNSRFWF